MLPDTEKYSYQLFTSTNLYSINFLPALLEIHTAGSSWQPSHKSISLMFVHTCTYWSYMSSPYYCSCSPLNDDTRSMLQYSSARQDQTDMYCLVCIPSGSIKTKITWHSGIYVDRVCIDIRKTCCNSDCESIKIN